MSEKEFKKRNNTIQHLAELFDIVMEERRSKRWNIELVSFIASKMAVWEP
jgi:hypothetical protein